MLRDCGVCSLSCGICSEEGRPTYWRSVTWRVPAGRSQQPPRPETQAAAHGKDGEVHGMEVPPVDHLEEVGGRDETEQGARRNEIRLHRPGRPSAGAGRNPLTAATPNQTKSASTRSCVSRTKTFKYVARTTPTA